MSSLSFLAGLDAMAGSAAGPKSKSAGEYDGLDGDAIGGEVFGEVVLEAGVLTSSEKSSGEYTRLARDLLLGRGEDEPLVVVAGDVGEGLGGG